MCIYELYPDFIQFKATVCKFYKNVFFFLYLLKLSPSRDNMRQIIGEKTDFLCFLSVILSLSKKVTAS